MLDATTSAVTAEGNIYQKATELLKKYPRAIAIVVSGGQIEWRTEEPHPKNKQDRRGWGARRYKGKDKMFGVILEEIDARYPDRPVFVFGYSQLMRGISYRSTRRVPSHFVLLYGKSMSICRLVQAAGRAHGDQARVLFDNGFKQVTFLTKAHDFDTIKNYPSFLEAIKDRMKGGMSLEDALKTQFSGKFNFSGREHGAKKLSLTELKQQILDFSETQPGDLPGAEAVEGEVTGFSAKRVVIEVLKFGMGEDNTDQMAMNTTQILTEIKASDYSAYVGSDVMPDSTQDINSILGALLEPLKSLARPAALVDYFEKSNRKFFYLESSVLDKLNFKAVVVPGTGTQVPPLSRRPSLTEDEDDVYMMDEVSDAQAEARHAEQMADAAAKEKEAEEVKKKAEQDEVTLRHALESYEDFHKLPAGTATPDQVQTSSAGVSGWAAMARRGSKGKKPAAAAAGSSTAAAAGSSTAAAAGSSSTDPQIGTSEAGSSEHVDSSLRKRRVLGAGFEVPASYRSLSADVNING